MVKEANPNSFGQNQLDNALQWFARSSGCFPPQQLEQRLKQRVVTREGMFGEAKPTERRASPPNLICRTIREANGRSTCSSAANCPPSEAPLGELD